MFFLAAFLREISAELLKILGPPGMSVPAPAWDSGRSFHCFFPAQKDSAGAWASLFCLAFFGFFRWRSELVPWIRKKRAEVLPLAEDVVQGWDPISAQRVKFLLPYPWHHLFALLKAMGTSINLLQHNLMAKFSVGAVCLGHTCQSGLAPANSTGHCWPSLALAGLLNINSDFSGSSVTADFK